MPISKSVLTWPNTVLPWGNGLMPCRTCWGEFVGYGAPEMKKVSEPMDGDATLADHQPRHHAVGGKEEGDRVQSQDRLPVMIPITDPITGVNANKLLIWDGKRWWAAVPGR